MNFGFNDEQNAIRDVVARFSAEVLAPGYRQRDKEGVIEKEVIRQLGEMGLLGVNCRRRSAAAAWTVSPAA